MNRLAGERPRATYAVGTVGCCPAGSGRAPVALRSCGGGNSKIWLGRTDDVEPLDKMAPWRERAQWTARRGTLLLAARGQIPKWNTKIRIM